MHFSSIWRNFASIMMKKYTLFIIYILLSLHIVAQPQYAPQTPFDEGIMPKHEVRATWIATIGGLDWPHSYAQNTQRTIQKQKDELCSILDKLQAAGMNTILLQTRVRGTTIYPSQYEPWDGCLSGRPGTGPGYDALAFAIEECHKRGMELHAWVVTIPVGKWNAAGCQQLRKRYPNLIKKIGADGYMNPEDAQTGKVVADLCEEIVQNYDVDGIHLDYIRYPEDWTIKVSRSRGRQYITDIARKISQRVKARKPWVKMSCSPIGKYDDLPRQRSNGWNANSRVCQDAQGWLRDGIMDMLFPMMYFKGQNFYPFALDWKENSYGKPVVPGLGIYFMSPKEQNWPLMTITQEMEVARSWGMGHCMYRSKFFTDNTKGIYDFTKNEFNTTLALTPPMTWADCPAPEAPTALTIDSITSTLSWTACLPKDGSDIMYNVYHSSEWPVNTNDPRNLMRIRYRGTSILAPMTNGYYAITAMNRYGMESTPLQMGNPGGDYLSVFSNLPVDGEHFLKNDGSTLHIPVYQKRDDLIVIESLQGITLKTTMHSDKVSIASLPEGVYQVRLLGKKNVSHKLGYFMILPREK